MGEKAPELHNQRNTLQSILGSVNSEPTLIKAINKAHVTQKDKVSNNLDSDLTVANVQPSNGSD